MMPHSVLRIWFGAIFSWLVLGIAIYCLWEAAQRMERRPRPVDERRLTAEEVAVERQARNREVEANRRAAKGLLAVGLGLLAYSVGGFLPISLFLGRPGGIGKARKPNRRALTVARPDGSQLHVEIFGQQQGPTLLFTHGWSLDSSVWSEVVAQLEDRYRIAIWDLPGLGNSQMPTNRNFQIEKMADDLAAVVDAIGKGPVLLVSHSIGGMITQTFCRVHASHLGKQVAGIVLLHTTYTNPLNTAFGRRLLKAIEKPIIAPLCHLTVWLAPLAWLSNWQSFLNGNLQLTTRLTSFSGSQTWGHLNYAAWLAAKAWPGVVGRGNLAMLEFDEQKTLPHIDVPVLVIAGEHDRLTCPDASDRLATLLAHSLESAVRTGHLGFWEKPSDIAALINEFAEQAGQGPPSGKPFKRWQGQPAVAE